MTYSISNNHLKLEVTKIGAEIASIQLNNTGKEYMWNADANYWASHAPVLFPIIGSLKNNTCTIHDVSYSIPKHGFIRNNNSIQLKNRTTNELNFQLKYSDDTLKMYPYKFRFQIQYRLERNKIVVTHKVENLDSKKIYFSLGAHPGFKCPVNEDEHYEDYYLEFEKIENSETVLLNSEGLISNKTRPMLTNTNILPLHKGLFNHDALIFKDLKSKKVSLKNKQSDFELTVRYTDFKYLGIWAKPNAPFVCIEPWLGIADHEESNGDFLKKDGMLSLKAGHEFFAEYSIEIRD